ncbi:MAG TPA: UPF0175 family protein [Acidobacteriota bacterium]|nr:UPF0175 family protein [Acidobacteriota bacterium]
MTSAHLDLNQQLIPILNQLNQPLPEAVNELIVLELYRRGVLSSGKAGEFLAMPRFEFIHFASRLGDCLL